MAAAALSAGATATCAAEAAPSRAQVQNARRLFVQAEADEDSEHWSDALDKLRAVADVKATAGVRYHIALCEEHLGQLLRARDDYQSADAQGHAEEAQDVLRLVDKQLSALDSRIPRLTVRVVPELPDTTIRVDGVSMTAAPDAPTPLDPGPHRIEVEAPHRVPTTVTVTLQERDSTVQEIKLAEAEAPPTAENGAGATTAATPSPALPAAADASLPGGHPARAPDHASRGLAIAATALTAMLIAGGAGAYVLSGAEHDRAIGACAGETSFSPCDSWKNRVRAWDFAAAGAWAAAVGTGTLAVVLWTRPSEPSSALAPRLLVGPSAVAIRGSF